MRNAHFIALTFVLLSTCRLATAQETFPPIAVDGNVEVDSIDIHRSRASYAVTSADLTFMNLDLWLNIGDGSNPEYLVQILKLSAIEDNTGTVLSTPERLKKIEALSGEVRSRQIVGRSGHHGPLLRLTLDVPSKDATHIKAIQGEIAVAATGREILKFKNLPKLVGKKLDDELLDDLIIKPQVEVEDDSVEIKLEITGPDDRLLQWTLAQNDRPVQPIGESRNDPKEEIQIVGQQYLKIELNEKSELWLLVIKSEEKQVIPFEFKDIELP